MVNVYINAVTTHSIGDVNSHRHNVNSQQSQKWKEKGACFYWPSESYDWQLQITCSISGRADLQVFSWASGEWSEVWRNNGIS